MAKARVLTRLELAEHLGVDKQMVTKLGAVWDAGPHQRARRGVSIPSGGGPGVAKGAGS